MRILLLTTQPTWNSWDEKLAACRGGLGLVKNMGRVEIILRRYGGEQPPVTEGKISRSWFNTLSISARREGFDAVVLHFSKNERERWGIRDGLRGSTINDDYIGEMWLSADEHDTIEYLDSTEVNRFVKVFLHECSHWLSEVLGQPDTTHYWDYERYFVIGAFFDYSIPLSFWERLTNLVMPERIVTPLAPILMKYRVSQAFGIRNPRYKSGIHNGTDYAVPVGTEVYAPADGHITVVWKDNPSVGNACLFEFYRDGRVHTLRILHLERPPKKGGYRRGSVIARTGNTGASTGPHCHLEVWKGGYEYSALLRERSVRERLVDPQVFFGITS